MNLSELRLRQTQLEGNIVGSDGDLSTLNTVHYILERGTVGESIEAMQALAMYGVESDEFRNEIIDIYVFFASLLNHIDMSDEELQERTRRIVTKNFIKYPATYAPETPIKDVMRGHKENWE